MAPRLSDFQHNLIRDMILSKSLEQADMATVAGCSERTIRSIATNLRLYGKTRAPSNGADRRRIITPVMVDALREYLLEKPGQYGDELALFLYDEFQVLVSTSSISRVLSSIGWTKKTIRHVPQERNVDLRDYYLYNLSAF
jgi:transposase